MMICPRIAAVLMEAMDPTVDPCHDFYQFACGGWLRKNSVPDASSRWGRFHVLREQLMYILKGIAIKRELNSTFKSLHRFDHCNPLLKTADILSEPNTVQDSKPVNSSREMYRACMDNDAIEKLGLTPLIQLLNSYGQWPMTVANWTADQFDWKLASTSIRRDMGESFLFEVYNYLDWKNTNKSSIYVR